MNEPGFEVGLFYLGIILAVLLIPATVIAVSGRWAPPLVWRSLFIFLLVLAGIGFLASFLITNEQPGDQRLYRGLAAAFAISTAAATWVVDRIRRREQNPGLLMLFLASVGTQFITFLIVAIARC